jgi:hypothetical protein
LYRITVIPFTLAHSVVSDSSVDGHDSFKFAKAGFGMFIQPEGVTTECTLKVRKNSADPFSQDFESCQLREFYVQYWTGYGNTGGKWLQPELVFELTVPSADPVPAGTPLFRATFFNFGPPNPVLFKLRLNRSTTHNALPVQSKVFAAGETISDADDFSLLAPTPIWGDPARTNDQHEPIGEFLDAHFAGEAVLRDAPWVAGMPGATTPSGNHWKFMGCQFYCYGEEAGAVLGQAAVSFYARASALAASTMVRPAGATGAAPTSVMANAYLIRMNTTTGARERLGGSTLRNLSSSSSASHTIPFQMSATDKNILFRAFVCLDDSPPSSDAALTYGCPNGILGTTTQNAFAISLFSPVGAGDTSPLRTLVAASASAGLRVIRSLFMTRANVNRATEDGLPIGMIELKEDPRFAAVISRSAKPGMRRIHSAAVWVQESSTPPFCRREQARGGSPDCRRFMDALAIPSDNSTNNSAWGSRMSSCAPHQMQHSDGTCIPRALTTSSTPENRRALWNAPENRFFCVVPTVGGVQQVLTTFADEAGVQWKRCTLPPCEMPGAIRDESTAACTCPSNTEAVGAACLPPCPAGSSRSGQTCACADATKTFSGGACVPCASAGKELVNGACVDPCPPDKVRHLGACLSKCPYRKELVDGKCVDPCPTGQKRAGSACECPEGQYMEDEKCKRKIGALDIALFSIMAVIAVVAIGAFLYSKFKPEKEENDTADTK